MLTVEIFKVFKLLQDFSNLAFKVNKSQEFVH
jgi:hypothetical protein